MKLCWLKCPTKVEAISEKVSKVGVTGEAKKVDMKMVVNFITRKR